MKPSENRLRGGPFVAALCLMSDIPALPDSMAFIAARLGWMSQLHKKTYKVSEIFLPFPFWHPLTLRLSLRP